MHANIYFDYNLQKMHETLEDSEEVPHAGIVFAEKVWGSQLQASAGFFTRKSRSKTLTDMYDCCDPLPNFDLVQGYRDDELECKKMYSDPDWFFRIWRDHIIQEAEQNRPKKTKKKKKIKERVVKERAKIETQAVR